MRFQKADSFMGSVLASLVPVFLVIIAGWAARVSGFVEERHWPGIERITYVIFFPAIIINTLARADLSEVPVLGMGGAMIAAILLIASLLLALRSALLARLRIDGPAFTSLFQGCTRWNTFVGLAVAGAMYGEIGLALMAVAVAAMIPLLNLLAIGVLVRYASGTPQSPAMIARTIVTNPFIWSSVTGIVLNVTGLPIPDFIGSTIGILGDAALAAGLLVVGAGLDMRRLARPRAPHWLSIGLKLFLLPVIAITIARLAGVSGDDLAIVAIATTVPTASGGYILAKQMGGDAPLMAEIITLQTLLAILTMPIMITLLIA
ncbi:AEC family transporter [Saliniramus fredricksonii]